MPIGQATGCRARRSEDGALGHGRRGGRGDSKERTARAGERVNTAARAVGWQLPSRARNFAGEHHERFMAAERKMELFCLAGT